jgi:hypothetical protein
VWRVFVKAQRPRRRATELERNTQAKPPQRVRFARVP